MKRCIVALCVCLCAHALFASGVENKTNLSTGYLRNPSRNTENQRPEAAFYNIAGTAFLKDGLWIEGGNQFVFKEYGNELKTNNKYAAYGIYDYYSNDETTVWLYPDFDIVYKKNRWATFLTFGVYAGGGSLQYSEGTSATTMLFLGGANKLKDAATLYGNAARAAVLSNPTLAAAYNAKMTEYKNAAGASQKMAQSHSLDVTSITYGGQIGAAYKVLDWLSLSAAYRYTIGTQEMSLTCNDITFVMVNGGKEISYDAVGFGQSCVFGIHAKPPAIPALDLSLQYQTLSRIDYDVSHVKGKLAQYYDITNDTKFRTDLPAVLNVGVGYSVFDNLYLSAGFNWYFNNFADQNSILSETDYKNSWEIAFGVDWHFCKYAGLSAGVSYGKQGITDTSNSTFNPVLDNIVYGVGVELYPVHDLTITLSCLYANYFDADYYLEGNKTTLSKDVTNLGIGLTYHFSGL